MNDTNQICRDTPKKCRDRYRYLWNGQSMSQDTHHMPKLDGNRVALRGRVFPDQHSRATAAAKECHLSLSDYLGALIDKAAGLPNKIDSDYQEALTFTKAS